MNYSYIASISISLNWFRSEIDLSDYRIAYNQIVHYHLSGTEESSPP